MFRAQPISAAAKQYLLVLSDCQFKSIEFHKLSFSVCYCTECG